MKNITRALGLSAFGMLAASTSALATERIAPATPVAAGFHLLSDRKHPV